MQNSSIEKPVTITTKSFKLIFIQTYRSQLPETQRFANFTRPFL